MTELRLVANIVENTQVFLGSAGGHCVVRNGWKNTNNRYLFQFYDDYERWQFVRVHGKICARSFGYLLLTYSFTFLVVKQNAFKRIEKYTGLFGCFYKKKKINEKRKLQITRISSFPFRKSIFQSCKAWKLHNPVGGCREKKFISWFSETSSTFSCSLFKYPLINTFPFGRFLMKHIDRKRVVHASLLILHRL